MSSLYPFGNGGCYEPPKRAPDGAPGRPRYNFCSPIEGEVRGRVKPYAQRGVGAWAALARKQQLPAKDAKQREQEQMDLLEGVSPDG